MQRAANKLPSKTYVQHIYTNKYFGKHTYHFLKLETNAVAVIYGLFL